jgi:hypothetical protein
MQRETVKSSNIKSVGYDKITLVLEIEFRTGSIYQHPNVPAAVYVRLKAAPSKGRSFAARIKDRHRCTRIR